MECLGNTYKLPSQPPTRTRFFFKGVGQPSKIFFRIFWRFSVALPLLHAPAPPRNWSRSRSMVSVLHELEPLRRSSSQLFQRKKRMFQTWTSSFEPVQPAQTSNKTQYSNAPQPLINKGIKKKRFKTLKFC